jgi:hypothetical protein
VIETSRSWSSEKPNANPRNHAIGVRGVRMIPLILSVTV